MTTRTRLRAAISLIGLAMLAGPSRAQLRVGPLISDGMVLQRGIPVPIRGHARPGAEVSLTFRGRSESVLADRDGRWQIELPPSPAGGPEEMTIRSGEEILRLRDILVGDVWLCSGQSNMEWVVADSMGSAAEIALAADHMIRHFKVPRSWAPEPASSLAGGAWQAAEPAHVGSFSAVGYFFARRLRRHVDAPIGLVNATWGGSRIEAWMRAEALGLVDDDVQEILAREGDYERDVLARIVARVGGLPDRDRGLSGQRAVWAAPDLDDSSWDEISAPGAWEEAGFEGMDGVAWYRKTFILSADEARSGVLLGLGAIDDSDISWVNGHEVGRTELAWNRPRLYPVPPAFLSPGRNVIAVRVEDTGGGGGIQGDPRLLFVEVAGRRRSLAGPWRFALGAVQVNLEDHKREVPTVLYNAMVHPLLDFPVKGILWYQGESNTGPDDAFVYRRLFSDMIRDWRQGWGAPDLPFLFVQLASFMAPVAEPGESLWALLRESQGTALALPQTAQVVAIDVGEAHDVHPRNKQAVGHRLALAARGVAYGHDLVFSGPRYRRHQIEGDRIVIAFDHVGSGLVAKDPGGELLRGFTVAGADRRFVWANATIQGDRVVVWSRQVPIPEAVRYAWADNPEGANLFNREGLPASPFRTDSW